MKFVILVFLPMLSIGTQPQRRSLVQDMKERIADINAELSRSRRNVVHKTIAEVGRISSTVCDHTRRCPTFLSSEKALSPTDLEKLPSDKLLGLAEDEVDAIIDEIGYAHRKMLDRLYEIESAIKSRVDDMKEDLYEDLAEVKETLTRMEVHLVTTNFKLLDLLNHNGHTNIAKELEINNRKLNSLERALAELKEQKDNTTEKEVHKKCQEQDLMAILDLLAGWLNDSGIKSVLQGLGGVFNSEILDITAYVIGESVRAAALNQLCNSIDSERGDARLILDAKKARDKVKEIFKNLQENFGQKIVRKLR